MEEFDPFSMEGTDISVHYCCCFIFVCMAKGAVKVFANRTVGDSGSSNYFTRCDVIYSPLFLKGYNCKYIIVPLDKVLAFQVGEFRKCRNVGTFGFPGSYFLCKGIFGCSSFLCC